MTVFQRCARGPERYHGVFFSQTASTSPVRLARRTICDAPGASDFEYKGRLYRKDLFVKVDVRWGDQDTLGHVNNCVYFRYFEHARCTLWRQVMGLEVDGAKIMNTEKEIIAPILASTSCRYRRPVQFPDTLRIGLCSEIVDVLNVVLISLNCISFSI